MEPERQKEADKPAQAPGRAAGSPAVFSSVVPVFWGAMPNLWIHFFGEIETIPEGEYLCNDGEYFSRLLLWV